MPKDASIRRVLIIGSGPIVIGQACEFDYSGTQAVRALREEGVGVVLLNSNPATIMTDPELAERTYIEPITAEVVDEILDLEQRRGTPVDALLPTLGGQTGLNTAMAAADGGVLEAHNVRMLGADRETIRRAEDRELFKVTALAAGVPVAKSEVAHSYEEALDVLERIPLPVVLRPAFTLGGSGGGRARTLEEFETIIRDGLDASPVRQVLIEEDLTGWKEFELEMMRDRRDNVVVVCSIENFDPMGVHTGDSITVAPALTLSDKEYQRMRDAAIAIMRAVGVETGGANIQFAVNPRDGRMIVIEMNPRVSRSSALASKATGFPIAKIATKLALGYTLDELRNDITRQTPACFEPAIDYCVVKMPRFTFEKFPDADETLTTAMKSVGEAMAIGRTFKEALQKCIRSMEIKRPGYGLHPNDRWLESLRPAQPVAAAAADEDQWLDPFGQHLPATGGALVGGSTMAEPPGDWREGSSSEWPISDEVLTSKIGTPCQGRLYYIRYALKQGWSVERISRLSGIDPWFLDQLAELVDFEQTLLHTRIPPTGSDPRSAGFRVTPEIAETFQQAKSLGYSDGQLRSIWRIDAATMARLKAQLDRPKFKQVDTCAGEFEACTPYYYSTHERPLARVFRDPAAVAQLRQRRPLAGGAALLMPPAAIHGGTAAVLGAAAERNGDEPGDVLRRLGAQSPYRYRVLDDEHVLVESHDDELRAPEKPVVVILGGGPNRIGQGIEFDYCCVHAAMAAREMGCEAVMVNSNPETVSTDYDISDKLFFEPLTHEHVLNICERLNGRTFGRSSDEVTKKRSDEAKTLGDGAGTHAASAPRRLSGSPPAVAGVIVQFGGQTPLNLAKGLKDVGVPILGTTPESIHLSEDRERFSQIIRELGLRQPPSEIAYSRLEAARLAEQIGYPILVRPSYVLGGRGMQVCNNANDLLRYIDEALAATDREAVDERHPILIDKFLLDAVEVDVDAISDYGRVGTWEGGEVGREENAGAVPTFPPSHVPAPPEGRCDICGIMEHIEEAGIHSGDSCCVLPPYSLSPSLVDEIKHQVKLLARGLGVCGLMNVQFAIQGRTVFVIEVNPRASRTIPFVSKATGIPWAKIATKVMLGMSLDEAMAGIPPARQQLPRHTSVKAPVFPFKKFRGVDYVLGPEMRSTGEVMGIDDSYPLAFAKAMLAAGVRLPTRGRVLVSVNDPDKPRVVSIARELHDLGFEIFSTIKTHLTLAEHGVPSRVVSKHDGQDHPFLLNMIKTRQLDLLINTPIHTGSASEEGRWRAASVELGIPLITTLAGARAAVGAIRAMRNGGKLNAKALQDYLA